MNKKLGLFSVLALTSSLSLAQGVPNTFSAGQPARAAEVNENFTSLATDITSNETAITDADARVTTLEGSVNSALTNITSNGTAISDTDTRVNMLEGTVDTLLTEITSNEAAITDNGARVTTLEGSVSSALTNITSNGTAISDTDARVDMLEGTVDTLLTDVTSNEAAITDADARITNLEGSVDPTTTTVNVDCASDSINNAINNAPAYGKLIVDISGACTETVLITRDNVSLIGAAGASIAYDAAITDSPYRSSLVSVINVIGADNVIISNLNLSGANDNARAAGLRILNSASVLISDVTVENNDNGIWASNNSSLQLLGSTIQSNSTYGVFITDGANAQMRENNTISHSSSFTAALGIYRNGSIRVREGGNTITNSSTPGVAIDLFHGSQFRNDNGSLTVNGKVIASRLSQVDFRDAIINGDLAPSRQSIIVLRTRNTVTVNGDVTVGPLGLFEATETSSNTSVSGDVICTGYNAATLISDIVIVDGSSDLNGSCNL